MFDHQQYPARRLFRSRTDRHLTGLSGGLAHHLNVDPTLVRIGWVVATALTFPVAPLAYVVAALVVPNEPTEHTSPVAGDTFAI
ncbi:MAG TPA: PspC domain-containing protein [Thermomicrobiales bacterium]|jgi:phage shock protein PspC (stress-responsive transcriptional regulator)